MRGMCHNAFMTIQTEAQKWIPRDNTFGARLALLRQRFGWNLKEASLNCGLPQNAWLEWESKGRVPRNLPDVALQISKYTDVDDYWLMTGRLDEDLPTDPSEGLLSDSNRRPPLYIVDGSTDWVWPAEAPKNKLAA